MKDYMRGTVVGLSLLVGAFGGYSFREYYPPIPKFIFNYDKNEPMAKGGSAVAGAGLGALIAIILTELLRKQNKS